MQPAEMVEAVDLLEEADGLSAGETAGIPLSAEEQEVLEHITKQWEAASKAAAAAAIAGGYKSSHQLAVEDAHNSYDADWDFAEALAEVVRVLKSEDVKQSGFLAISCDEVTDNSKRKYLGLHVYYLDTDKWQRKAVFVKLAELKDAWLAT